MAPIPFASAALGWMAAYIVGGLLLGGLIAAAVASFTTATVPPLLAGLVGSWGTFIVVLVVLSRREGSGDFAKDYAVAFRPVDLVMVPLAVGLQFAVNWVYWPLRQLWPSTFSDEALSKTARDLVDSARGVNLVLLVLAVALGAPIVEELVYRGLLQRSLSSVWSPVAAWVAGSAWFALIHFRPVEYLGLFLAGLLFGAGYVLTGRIGPGVIAHIAFNVTGLVNAAQPIGYLK